MDPVEELHKLDGVNCRKAIAGGIKLETFEDAVNSPADVIICGGGIYNQPNMRAVARQMRGGPDGRCLQCKEGLCGRSGPFSFDAPLCCHAADASGV